MVQSKFGDWKETACDIFNDLIGDDLNNPTQKFIKKGKNTLIFERNYND